MNIQKITAAGFAEEHVDFFVSMANENRKTLVGN